VKRALDLWEQGEKVLVFCHYVQTGKALEQHLSTAMDQRLRDRKRALAGTEAKADRIVTLLGGRFDKGERYDEMLRERMSALIETHEQGLEDASRLADEHRELLFDVVRRFVRQESFLVRYFDLGGGREDNLLDQALAKPDASGLSLQQKLDAFLRFIIVRSKPHERKEYLESLGTIATGSRHGRTEKGASGERLPNVRLVNGGTGPDERRRIMLAYQTPFFPEILIASAVMAEGVDLHLECRHIIHHDLCWNPSTLEQRTGRVDRLGAKAEKVSQSIRVYLPYVGGTQDEKMFRVVRDRERWFQVLMGEAYELDESTTERLAARVPLPESAAKALALRLEVATEPS
jgi:ERCC4-related helicase